ATSIISGIYLVMTASLGIWFGSLVDHNKKKKVLILSGVISLVIYIIGFIIYLIYPAETWKNPTSATLWIFNVLLLIGVIAGNIRSIAVPTLVTILIPERINTFFFLLWSTRLPNQIPKEAVMTR
ncbi:MAG: hypothetical protein ACKOBD_00285, partial [Chloroflexota bacterium]